MDLSPEQQELVRAWAAQGDSISDIQTKLASECGVHLSYMDTRFLLLDLSVTLAEKNAKKAEPAPAPEPEPGPEGYGAVPPLPGGEPARLRPRRKRRRPPATSGSRWRASSVPALPCPVRSRSPTA